jgi:hypothetical protein
MNSISISLKLPDGAVGIYPSFPSLFTIKAIICPLKFSICLVISYPLLEIKLKILCAERFLENL